jgi:hypothetical protein
MPSRTRNLFLGLMSFPERFVLMATVTKSKRWKILSFRRPTEAPRRNFCIEKAKRGGAMRRDLLTMTGTSLALGLIVWSFWGNPVRSPLHLQTVQSIPPAVELASQGSFMRAER